MKLASTSTMSTIDSQCGLSFGLCWVLLTWKLCCCQSEQDGLLSFGGGGGGGGGYFPHYADAIIVFLDVFLCVYVCVKGGCVHGVVFVCMVHVGGRVVLVCMVWCLCDWCMCVHLLCYVDRCLYCRCRITSSFSVYKNTKWAMEWMTSDLQR